MSDLTHLRYAAEQRLCPKGQPWTGDDNRTDHGHTDCYIIGGLLDALDAAEAWKEEATDVIERWQSCYDPIVHELHNPAALGRFKSDLVREWIVAAEAEIARLRRDNDLAVEVVETVVDLRTKLAAIDALHSPQQTITATNIGIEYGQACLHCLRAWPCPTHLILHPEDGAA